MLGCTVWVHAGSCQVPLIWILLRLTDPWTESGDRVTDQATITVSCLLALESLIPRLFTRHLLCDVHEDRVISVPKYRPG